MFNKHIENISLKRAFAVIALVAFTMVTLFSSCYIIKEADHDCQDPACQICDTINLCKDLLKKIGSGQIAAAVIIMAFCILCCAVLFAADFNCSETLITCKVRLNN